MEIEPPSRESSSSAQPSLPDKLDLPLSDIISKSNGCFHCGRLGHIARLCPDKVVDGDRKCYQCGKAGHFARDCPQQYQQAHYQQVAAPMRQGTPYGGPYVGAASCYACGKPGHIARDCKLGEKCYVCGRPGHLARDCQAAVPASPACYSCGGFGHIARDCRNAGETCYSCGRPGHRARDCKAGEEACFVCGEVGHMARECKKRAVRPGTGWISSTVPSPVVAYVSEGVSGGSGVAASIGPGVGSGGGSGGAAGGFKSTRVYVGNLSYDTTWQDLKDHMRQACPNVVRCDIMISPAGRSKGCGVVELGTVEGAAQCVRQLNDTVLKGRKIFVREDREVKGFGFMP